MLRERGAVTLPVRRTCRHAHVGYIAVQCKVTTTLSAIAVGTGRDGPGQAGRGWDRPARAGRGRAGKGRAEPIRAGPSQDVSGRAGPALAGETGRDGPSRHGPGRAGPRRNESGRVGNISRPEYPPYYMQEYLRRVATGFD